MTQYNWTEQKLYFHSYPKPMKQFVCLYSKIHRQEVSSLYYKYLRMCNKNHDKITGINAWHSCYKCPILVTWIMKLATWLLNSLKNSVLVGQWLDGGEWCAHAGILGLLTFFCFLKISTLQLGMVEHLKVRQNCHKIENHDFQFIHRI